jgi:hypothetical protein
MAIRGERQTRSRPRGCCGAPVSTAQARRFFSTRSAGRAIGRTTAAAAVAANPDKSDRAIAPEIGVGSNTVRRARRATAPNGAVEARTGRDGKKREQAIDQPEPAPASDVADRRGITPAGRSCFARLSRDLILAQWRTAQSRSPSGSSFAKRINHRNLRQFPTEGGETKAECRRTRAGNNEGRSPSRRQDRRHDGGG